MYVFMDRWMDGLMDGWMDICMYVYLYIPSRYIPWVVPEEDEWGMGSGCRRW